MNLVIADKLVFPEIVWQMPQNLYRPRKRLLFVGGSPGNLHEILQAGEAASALKFAETSFAVPESLVTAIKTFLPQISVTGLPTTPQETISSAASLDSSLFDVLIAGFGLTKHSETKDFVNRAISIDKPVFVVGDAVDGLEKEALAKAKSTLLVVGDAGKISRLAKSIDQAVSSQEIVQKFYHRPQQELVELAAQYNLNLLLTSPQLLFSDSQGRAVIYLDDIIPNLEPTLTGLLAGFLSLHPSKIVESIATTLYLLSLIQKEGQTGQVSLEKRIASALLRLEREAS